MSEDNTPNGRGTDHTINRRKVLRSMAAVGGVSGLGMVAGSSIGAAESDDDSSFTVTGARVKSAEDAAVDRRVVEEADKTSRLASTMVSETSREAGDVTLSYELETKEEEAQKAAPAITVVPMKPPETDWNSISRNEVALQFSLTVDNDGEREPVSALGMSFRDKEDEDDLSPMENGVAVDLYGQDDNDEIGVVGTNQVPAQELDGPTPNDLGCTGCKVVVGAICVGVNGTLGRSGCISRCIPIVISNPLIGSGCGALCIALTSTFGKIACGSGGLSEAACRVIDFC